MAVTSSCKTALPRFQCSGGMHALNASNLFLQNFSSSCFPSVPSSPPLPSPPSSVPLCAPSRGASSPSSASTTSSGTEPLTRRPSYRQALNAMPCHAMPCHAMPCDAAAHQLVDAQWSRAHRKQVSAFWVVHSVCLLVSHWKCPKKILPHLMSWWSCEIATHCSAVMPFRALQ